MRRITAREDDAINAKGRQARHACHMTLTTRAGAVLRQEVYDRRGSPENPVDQAALEAKFRGNVRECLPDQDAGRILAIVADFEMLDSTNELTAILGQAA